MISYVLPTRNRPDRLRATLDAIGRLASHASIGGAEVIVVDNASDTPPTLPATLANDIPVSLIRRTANEGAAARNAGAAAADPASTWIVMLDDDSHPLDTGLIQALTRAPVDAAAVTADIRLPAVGGREAGGLPEVPVGCGVAYRRDIYQRLGGYDPTFDYYVEEYDLAARIILAGYRIHHDPWFRVAHHKVTAGRDFARIVARLVRNNGWVAQRYAPAAVRRAELREMRARYRRIADKENVIEGYAAGLTELRRTIRQQPRTPMPTELHDRFTGLAAARAAVSAAGAIASAAVVGEGKNAWAVHRALREHGVREVPIDDAEALVIGTMSPGPMADLLERLETQSIPVIAPWLGLRPGRDLRRSALTSDARPREARRDTRIPA